MILHPLTAGPDWGTVPDWLAAIGTLAAFAVALRLLAKELAARREQEEDRRSEQARLVSAWTRCLRGYPTTDTNTITVVMRNASQEVIYDIHLVMEHPDQPGTVAMAESWAFLPPEDYGERERRLVRHLPGPITLTFTDAAGRRWTRYPDGRLVEADGLRRRSRKDYMNAWIAGEIDQLDY